MPIHPIRRGPWAPVSKGFLVGVLAVLAGAHNTAGGQGAQGISTHADEYREVPGFIVLADRRMFAVMAFLNAAGYDDEPYAREMPALRVRIRQMVAANLQQNPQKLASWRKLYAGWKKAHIMLPRYQEYALSLTQDYPFQPAASIPLKQLREFHRVLNDFWQAAKLDEIWKAVTPDYLSELRSYPLESLQSGVNAVWEYLHMIRSDTFTFVIVPNPLCQSRHAQAVPRSAMYYIVDGPLVGRGFNSHEYLHSIVDPIVNACFARQKRKLDQRQTRRQCVDEALGREIR